MSGAGTILPVSTSICYPQKIKIKIWFIFIYLNLIYILLG